MTEKAIIHPFLLSTALPMLLIMASASEAKATSDQAPFVTAQADPFPETSRAERRRERDQLRDQGREEREKLREERQQDRQEMRDLPRDERRQRREELQEQRRQLRWDDRRPRARDRLSDEPLGFPDQRTSDPPREPQGQEPPSGGRF